MTSSSKYIGMDVHTGEPLSLLKAGYWIALLKRFASPKMLMDLS
jgi:hypothetical protein